MALSQHAKNQMADDFRGYVKHFQIYGTYYPNGLGGSSIAYPVNVQDQIIGTDQISVYAFDRVEPVTTTSLSNVLSLNAAYLPTSGQTTALVWTITVPIGAVLDIQGIKLWSGKPGNFGEYQFDATDSQISEVVFDYAFDTNVRFSSDGEFSITGFQLTVN